MDIWVCVKQVLDTRLPLRVADQGTVTQEEISPVLAFNPADRCALEQAMLLRERTADCRVTAITVGPPLAEAVLVRCLARGADRVVHLIPDAAAAPDSFAVAQYLASEIRQDRFDLVLCGYRTLDDGAAEVGPVLGELLGIAQVTGVVRLTVSTAERTLLAERKLERGYRQTVEAVLPALVSVDESICEPAYVTVRAMRRAAKALAGQLRSIPVQNTAVPNLASLRKVVRTSFPKPRPKKIARPSQGVSAANRMAAMMAGASLPKSTKALTGDVASISDEIIDFLREKGLLVFADPAERN